MEVKKRKKDSIFFFVGLSLFFFFLNIHSSIHPRSHAPIPMEPESGIPTGSRNPPIVSKDSIFYLIVLRLFLFSCCCYCGFLVIIETKLFGGARD